MSRLTKNLRRLKVRTFRVARRAASRLIGVSETLFKDKPEPITVENFRHHDSTEVEEYWTGYLVNPNAFLSARESRRYLEWRFRLYPQFREFMQLWGNHTGEVVLDYGCGPGDDTTGLLLYSGAAQVIGVDVSPKALSLTRRRLELHRVDPARVRLIRIEDRSPDVPLGDASVDFVNSSGVLHHASSPEGILAEFRRIMRPGARGNVMVYNIDSVWAHLVVAYELMVRGGKYPGLPLEQAVQRTVDGEECPIARFYRHEDFIGMCNRAGLGAVYVGGYLSRGELKGLRRRLDRALGDPRLPARSREFLDSLEFDERGHPVFESHLSGWAGVYRLTRE